MSNFTIVQDSRAKVYPWQCTLCGSVVAHVDRHAEWHRRIEGIEYGDQIPDPPRPDDVAR